MCCLLLSVGDFLRLGAPFRPVLLRWRNQWVSQVETETGKVELVNTAANKTKLDDTNIAARFKTACLKASNKNFARVVEKQWSRVEGGEKSHSQLYEKVRNEYRRLYSSTIEDDDRLTKKELALVTGQAGPQDEVA